MPERIVIPPWPIEARAINATLDVRYGRDVIRNKPKYRIAWSTAQTEFRYGSYDIYYGHIYLRTETGLNEVPKYPHFPNCYILERFVFAPIAEIPETSNGHYECIYNFQTADGTALEPNFRVCEIVIFAQQNPYKPGELMAILEKEDQKILEDEIKYFEDRLHDEGRSALFFDPHAVVVVPNKESQ